MNLENNNTPTGGAKNDIDGINIKKSNFGKKIFIILVLIIVVLAGLYYLFFVKNVGSIIKNSGETWNYEIKSVTTENDACNYAFDCVSNENDGFSCKYFDENYNKKEITCSNIISNYGYKNILDKNQAIYLYKVHYKYDEEDDYKMLINTKTLENQFNDSIDDVKEIGKYVCESNECSYLLATKQIDNSKAVIRDNGKYFYYDFYLLKKEEIKNVDLRMYYTYDSLIDEDSNLYGFIFNNSKTISFYDYKNSKILVDYGSYYDFAFNKKDLQRGNIIFVENNDVYEGNLYNINSNKIISEKINGYLTLGNKFYYVYEEKEYSGYIYKILDEDLNIIVDLNQSEEGLDDRYIFINNEGNLNYIYNGKIYEYNSSAKSVSENINIKYDNVYMGMKNYLVVGLNNNIELYDYFNNKKIILGTTTDKTEFVMRLSGYNQNMDTHEWQVEATFLYDDCQCYYKYYYAPSTGEYGKKAVEDNR